MIANASTLRYASASDPNAQRQYELTFENADGVRSINWVSDLGDLNVRLGEMRAMGQTLINLREVYVQVLAFQPMRDELHR
jgi:hypothetical protein